MLNKKYLQEIKEIVKEAVIDALTVEITLEKHRDDITGLPLAKPEIIKEKVFLPSFIVQNIAYQEGAFRGVQEDISKRNDAVDNLARKLEAVARVLIDIREPIIEIAKQKYKEIE